jgi:hypothetical protein
MATAVDSIVSKPRYVEFDECLATVADLELAQENFPGCADYQILLAPIWTGVEATNQRKFLLFKEEDPHVTKVLKTFRCLASKNLSLYTVKAKARAIPGYDFKRIYLKFSLDGCAEVTMPDF